MIILNSDSLFLNNLWFFLLQMDEMRSKFRAPVSPTGVALGSLRWGGEPSVRLMVMLSQKGRSKPNPSRPTIISDNAFCPCCLICSHAYFRRNLMATQKNIVFLFLALWKDKGLEQRGIVHQYRSNSIVLQHLEARVLKVTETQIQTLKFK